MVPQEIMGTHETPWSPMKPYGALRCLMVPYEALQNVMIPHQALCEPLRTTNPRGFLRPPDASTCAQREGHEEHNPSQGQ